MNPNSKNELIIRSQRVMLFGARTPQPATLFIRDGQIEKIIHGNKPPSESNSKNVLDVGESVVMAGIVETHAHINEPGRTEWEGFRTATKAAAAGGITTIVDMPLNSIPATTTVSALQAKASAALGHCLIDYGFWGGVVPGNTRELAGMIEKGVLGFKVFLIDSGVAEFPAVKEADLRESMPLLARAGVPLLVHAELDQGAQRTLTTGSDPKNYRHYMESRPSTWEVDAVRMMIRLSRETGCRVHIVHLSAADALADLKKARDEGMPITVETCPHYLTFCEEEIPEGATFYKCAPPIRGRDNQDRLWQGLKDSVIDMIVSDHSPCTPELKRLETGNFDKAWGGISGLQFSLSTVWTGMRKRGFAIADVARFMCQGPAHFAGLEAHKGSIVPGKDADLVIWDPETSFTLDASQVHHRHSLTPYVGKEYFGRVKMTFVRGVRVYDSGTFSEEGRGEWRAKPEFALKGQNTMIQSLPGFTDLPDLLSERLGGKALLTNDDFFAPKENLIKFSQPVFIPEKYTEFGKWMDGWESRRKRGVGPGNDHDWCILKLGAPGVILGVDVDTAHFLGNFPEYCAIDACTADPLAKPETLVQADWKEVFARTKLSGGSHHYFSISDSNRFTHVRLRIFPDGGVARLRVYGEVKPDWAVLRATQSLLDLVSVMNGGRVVTCNDMFFGPKENLILPGRAETMGDGWETKRKRGPGHDWIVLKLGAAGRIQKIEVDTNHFKGNFPESCSIEGCSYSGSLEARDLIEKKDLVWVEILPQTKLTGHTQHYFEREFSARSLSMSFSYLRLNIFPDGGISRLRVWGTPG